MPEFLMWAAYLLVWVAYLLTTFKIEALIKPIKDKRAGLVGMVALGLLLWLYIGAYAITTGQL